MLKEFDFVSLVTVYHFGSGSSIASTTIVDHYYIKAADASRIYGLELEHLLSPNRITFLHHETHCCCEEHIPGIPGDVFLDDYLNEPETNKIGIAKKSSWNSTNVVWGCLATCVVIILLLTHNAWHWGLSIPHPCNWFWSAMLWRKKEPPPQFYKELLNMLTWY